MLFYLIITILSSLIMYFIQYKRKRVFVEEDGIYDAKKYKYLYLLPFIPLFLVSALRYGIGTDYFYTYYPAFQKFRQGIIVKNQFEIGYVVLNLIVARFSDYFVWVTTFCAFLFFIFLAKAIMEQSDNPAISILLLVGTGLFSFSMNGMRQAIAIAIWIYSIKYIKQKKFKTYLFLMLLASLFHMSAFIMIPFYFIYTRVKIKPLSSIIITVATVIFSSTLRKILLFFASFTKYYNKFIGTVLVNGDFAISSTIILVLVLLYTIYLYKNLKKYWEYNFLLMSVTIASCLSIVTKDIYIAARILVFFQYLPAIYFPMTLKAFERKSSKLVSFLFVLAYFASIWFMVGYLKKGATVPYCSIFNIKGF